MKATALPGLAAYLRSPGNPVVVPEGMPATVEVGMGAGHVLVARARTEPDRFFVGIEIKEERAYQAARAADALGLANVAFVVGEVSRIDPAAQNGSVIVDVKFVDTPPKNIRADLNVDGKIELEKTTDTLYVSRPAIGEAHATVQLFVIEGDEARRTTVKFRRAAVKDIEIASGLREGDQVILTDMAKWDGVDRLRIADQLAVQEGLALGLADRDDLVALLQDGVRPKRRGHAVTDDREQ